MQSLFYTSYWHFSKHPPPEHLYSVGQIICRQKETSRFTSGTPAALYALFSLRHIKVQKYNWGLPQGTAWKRRPLFYLICVILQEHLAFTCESTCYFLLFASAKIIYLINQLNLRLCKKIKVGCGQKHLSMRTENHSLKKQKKATEDTVHEIKQLIKGIIQPNDIIWKSGLLVQKVLRNREWSSVTMKASYLPWW